jgi:hypothetical protein
MRQTTRFARLLRGTIWDPVLLEEVPPRFRWLYTVLLPVNYTLLALFGAFGIIATIAPVAQVTSLSYANIWTLMVGLTATLTLVGLACRLEAMELYCGIALTIGMATYPVADVILSLRGDLQHASLAFGLFTFILLPSWRVVDIVRIRRHRKFPPVPKGPQS